MQYYLNVTYPSSVTTFSEYPARFKRVRAPLIVRNRSVAIGLFSVAVGLIGISYLGAGIRLYCQHEGIPVHRYVEHVIDKFYVDYESNISTLYNVCLLLLSSVLLWLIRHTCTQRRVKRHYWTVLAVIFLLMSIDESTGIHELFNVSTLREYAPQNRFLHWTWVIPGALFVAGVFLYYIPFLRALPRRTAGLMLVAGAIYVGGAIGMELVGSVVLETHDFLSGPYTLAMHAEELMEMTGLVVFIYALLDYIRQETGQISVAFGPVRAKRAYSIMASA